MPGPTCYSRRSGSLVPLNADEKTCPLTFNYSSSPQEWGRCIRFQVKLLSGPSWTETGEPWMDSCAPSRQDSADVPEGKRSCLQSQVNWSGIWFELQLWSGGESMAWSLMVSIVCYSQCNTEHLSAQQRGSAYPVGGSLKAHLHI